MFNQVGKNSVTLSTFGGLVTEAPAAALSEGSSPLCWDVDFLVGSVFTRPGLSSVYGAGVNSQNFVWVKTFQLQTGQTYTLALASDGTLWREDVTNSPGSISQISNLFTANDRIKSSTAFQREYMSVYGQHDIPRQYDGTNLDRISQEGPAAPPNFVLQATANPNLANITSFSVASSTLTVIANNSFAIGTILQLQTTTASPINGLVVTVATASGTQFTASTTLAATSSTAVTGTATPLAQFPISSITQNASKAVGGSCLWSSGPGSMQAGTTWTIYYGPNQTPDNTLISLFNAGIPLYVYMNFNTAAPPFVNGTYKILSIGLGYPVSGSTKNYFFTLQAPYSAYSTKGASNNATYEITLATVTLTTPLPSAQVGNTVSIQGATPTTWNNTWSIVSAPNSGVLNITQTALSGGTATYTFTLQSGNNPVVGDLVTVTNTTNGNGIFNVTNATIATVGGGTFTVGGFTTNLTFGTQAETGQAQDVGKVFYIDPGPQFVGTSGTGTPIFGNAGASGFIVYTNTVLNISSGTRQAVVLFLTRNGYLSKPSPPVTFTVASNTNAIQCTNIPVGPPDVVARWIAFTEAGANGVPGAYFYVIPTPVQTIVNGQPYTYAPTVIPDNVTTSATFSFVDSVLLSSLEIDITGGNQFNMIELGSCQWNINYASRMFYGGADNKVTNFLNMSFNGGYIPSPGSPNFPLGWTADKTFGLGGSLIASSTFGNSYYIQNDIGSPPATPSLSQTAGGSIAATTYFVKITYVDNAGETLPSGEASLAVLVNNLLVVTSPSASGNASAYRVYVSTTTNTETLQATVAIGTNWTEPTSGLVAGTNPPGSTTLTSAGMLTQGAYQDAYKVPILLANTTYSVRVAARIPSGNTGGNLVVDLVPFDPNLGYGTVVGSFTIPFSSLTTTVAVNIGTLLTTVFTTVPGTLVLRVYATNLVAGADVEVDRIEVFPTQTPTLSTVMLGSYVNNPEAIDGVTGPLGLAGTNTQPAFGAFVMYDQMFILKNTSMFSTQDTPGAEPSGWTVNEVSNRVGTCGPLAYDSGEEWAVTLCRNGVYVFSGRQPVKISQEIFQVLEALNWTASQTFWVRNDIVNRRILIGVAMPTPNQWLPNAPTNSNPTSPNVLLMCNYQGLNDVSALEDGAQMHTTMFGTLMSVDMRRKWTIWQITSPYADFILRQDGQSKPLFLGNGALNGKIYQLLSTQHSDDGAAINSLYTTYGFVDVNKGKENPLLGMHRKIWTYLQSLVFGSGALTIKGYANSLTPPQASQIYTAPAITLSATPFDDYERPFNLAGNRCFMQFSTNAVGAWFNLQRLILVGGEAPLPLRGSAAQ